MPDLLHLCFFSLNVNFFNIKVILGCYLIAQWAAYKEEWVWTQGWLICVEAWSPVEHLVQGTLQSLVVSPKPQQDSVNEGQSLQLCWRWPVLSLEN